MKRAQNQMNQQFGQQEAPYRKEGEVNIDTSTSKSKTSQEKNQLGDYVDFEETKDE